MPTLNTAIKYRPGGSSQFNKEKKSKMYAHQEEGKKIFTICGRYYGLCSKSQGIYKPLELHVSSSMSQNLGATYKKTTFLHSNKEYLETKLKSYHL